MKSLSMTLFALGLFAQAAGKPAQPQAAPTIAFVSVQRILTESTDAQAAAKKLEALRQERNRDLNQKNQALEAIRVELANAAGTLTSDRRAELQEQEKRQQGELQRATQQAQSELQELQRQSQADLRANLGVIVAELAARRKLQVVLNGETSIIWAPPQSDLTSEVLARLNAPPR